MDVETRYVLNRYFDAFSSVTERDLKWIDYLDCIRHNKKLSSWKKFEQILSRETFPVNGDLILGNMNNKALGQWLELLSRKHYKDTTRKMDSKKIEKLKADIHNKLYLHKEDMGLEGLVSLLNFIQYLIDEHDGSFFAVKQSYWRVFISIKFWFSHFWEDPEIIINLLIKRKERQPES